MLVRKENLGNHLLSDGKLIQKSSALDLHVIVCDKSLFSYNIQYPPGMIAIELRYGLAKGRLLLPVKRKVSMFRSGKELEKKF